jgi:uncharacterized membrane protein
MTIFGVLITLHIAGGFTGLVTGTIATIVKKGSKLHNACGKLFFWGMMLASVAALIISNLPKHHNIFLFAVGGFTLYMISSGYRIIHLKRKLKQTAKPFTWIDYLIFSFAIGFGIFLLYLGIKAILGNNMFGIVPCVFGSICIGYAGLDARMLFGKVALKQAWMPNHISRMIGALVASYTAFLVVNVKVQIEWMLWVAPSILGFALATYFTRKYAPKKKVTRQVAE